MIGCSSLWSARRCDYVLMAYYNCDLTLIQLRFGFDSTTTENKYVHFFAESKGVVANHMAKAGSSYEELN